MNTEIEILQENNTWTLVPRPKGKKIVGSRWVFKIKRSQNREIEKYKARLVAQVIHNKKGQIMKRFLHLLHVTNQLGPCWQLL